MKRLITIFAVAATMMLSFTANAQQKFGHVNSQEVFYSMPEVAAVEQELIAKGQALEAQIGILYTQYETLVVDIQENGPSWMQAVLEAKYNEVYLLEEKIMLAEEQAQTELYNMEMEKLAPIEEKAYNAIQAVASANGYTYVLDSSVGVFLVLPEGDDLTNMVKAHLGIAY
ncbi:MAG: OmpH family outer membrane protein [Chitinophagales bacterium]